MTQAQKILLGLGLGVLAGLMFGDACAHLKVVGTVFLKLMQMTVMPYVILSLILGIGRLNPTSAKLVARRGLSLLLATWGLGALMLLVVPLTFPQAVTSSYYSGPTEFKQIGLDGFIELFIPANIFKALSEELIPSIILFCICLGVMLMSVERKESFLKMLETLTEAIERLAGVVSGLMPVGVFAMAAVTAGTMTWGEISRLQVYVLSLVVMAVFATFWLLPAFIRVLLPISYRDLMRYCREPLLIAFSAGSFVALPLIGEKIKALMREQGAPSTQGSPGDEKVSHVDVVLPIAFVFPTMAGFFDLLFIRFTSWSYDIPLDGLQLLKLVLIGVPALFSEANAIPFLLQQFQLPLDSHNLYIMSGVFGGHFFAMLNGMCLLTIALLSAAAMAGKMVLRPRMLALSAVLTVVLGGGTLFALRATLAFSTRQAGSPPPKLLALSLDNEARKPQADAVPTAPPVRGQLLEDILKRGTLRVAYSPDGLPWSYRNARGEMVGYDIAFAHQLARDMNVALDLVPIDFSRWTDDLEARRYDIAMVAFSISPERMVKVDFTTPHRHLPSVFVVKDHRKEEFLTRERMQKIAGLRLAVLDGTKRKESAARDFPEARIVPIARIEDFFLARPDLADAWYTEAGKGYAYSLMYPAYDAVQQASRSTSTALDAYPIPKGEPGWLAYLNTFLRLQKENGFEVYNFEKYILGKHFSAVSPRWCIARNVLHWID